MSLPDQLEEQKAYFLRREREIMDNCLAQVAKAEASKAIYNEKLAALDMLFDHMDYDAMYRVLRINEDKLNLLGFTIVGGKVQL